MKKSVPACLAILLLALAVISASFGCQEESEEDDDLCDIEENVYAPTRVKWWIDDNGALHWKNAADVSEFRSDNNYNITVTWYCADYKDWKNAYVQLSFWDWEGDGQGWILEDEYVSTGICEEECL